jgi:hypothetical protein
MGRRKRTCADKKRAPAARRKTSAARPDANMDQICARNASVQTRPRVRLRPFGLHAAPSLLPAGEGADACGHADVFSVRARRKRT